MKHTKKKLAVKRETIRRLGDLTAVRGAIITESMAGGSCEIICQDPPGGGTGMTCPPPTGPASVGCTTFDSIDTLCLVKDCASAFCG